MRTVALLVVVCTFFSVRAMVEITQPLFSHWDSNRNWLSVAGRGSRLSSDDDLAACECSFGDGVAEVNDVVGLVRPELCNALYDCDPVLSINLTDWVQRSKMFAPVGIEIQVDVEPTVVSHILQQPEPRLIVWHESFLEHVIFPSGTSLKISIVDRVFGKACPDDVAYEGSGGMNAWCSVSGVLVNRNKANGSDIVAQGNVSGSKVHLVIVHNETYSSVCVNSSAISTKGNSRCWFYDWSENVMLSRVSATHHVLRVGGAGWFTGNGAKFSAGMITIRYNSSSLEPFSAHFRVSAMPNSDFGVVGVSIILFVATLLVVLLIMMCFYSGKWYVVWQHNYLQDSSHFPDGPARLERETDAADDGEWTLETSVSELEFSLIPQVEMTNTESIEAEGDALDFIVPGATYCATAHRQHPHQLLWTSRDLVKAWHIHALIMYLKREGASRRIHVNTGQYEVDENISIHEAATFRSQVLHDLIARWKSTENVTVHIVSLTSPPKYPKKARHVINAWGNSNFDLEIESTMESEDPSEYIDGLVTMVEEAAKSPPSATKWCHAADRAILRGGRGAMVVGHSKLRRALGVIAGACRTEMAVEAFCELLATLARYSSQYQLNFLGSFDIYSTLLNFVRIASGSDDAARAWCRCIANLTYIEENVDLFGSHQMSQALVTLGRNAVNTKAGALYWCWAATHVAFRGRLKTIVGSIDLLPVIELVGQSAIAFGEEVARRWCTAAANITFHPVCEERFAMVGFVSIVHRLLQSDISLQAAVRVHLLEFVERHKILVHGDASPGELGATLAMIHFDARDSCNIEGVVAGEEANPLSVMEHVASSSFGFEQISRHGSLMKSLAKGNVGTPIFQSVRGLGPIAPCSGVDPI